MTTAAMRVVVLEITEPLIHWLNVSVGIQPQSPGLYVIPEAIIVRASNTVLLEVVVRMHDPEARRRQVRVEIRPATPDLHD